MVVSKRDGKIKQTRSGVPPLFQAAAAIVVVMIALVAFFLMDSDVVKVKKNAYYYDMASGMVFVAEKQLLPLDMPGGGEAVHAHVFTCGSCSEGEWFVGILETYEDGIPDVSHQRVASPVQPGQTPNWISSLSPSSVSVNKALLSRCGDGKPKRCDAGNSIGFSIIPPKSPNPGEKVVMNKPGAAAMPTQESELATIERRTTHDTISPSMPSYEAPEHWSVGTESVLTQQGAILVAL